MEKFVKESRADFRYYPAVKELKDVMCIPTNEDEKQVLLKSLEHYEKTR